MKRILFALTVALAATTAHAENYGLHDQYCVTLNGETYCFDSEAEAQAFLAANSVSPMRPYGRYVSRTVTNETFGLGVSREVTRARSVETFGLGSSLNAVSRPRVQVREFSQVTAYEFPKTSHFPEPEIGTFQETKPVAVRSRARIVRRSGGGLLRRIFQRFRGRLGARRGRSVSRSYSSSVSNRWTWPGMTEASLDNHLRDWPHFQSPDGWSYQQKVNFHDSHHDQIGPVSSAQLRANRSRSRSVVRVGGG